MPTDKQSAERARAEEEIVRPYICVRCKEPKSLSELKTDRNKKTGHTTFCKRCDQLSVRRYRQNNAAKYLAERRQYANRPEVRKRGKALRRGTMKDAARELLRKAVRSNKVIKPTMCESCGVSLPIRKIQGHHPDYSKPFDVMWLCSPCHGKEHRKYA